MLSFGKTKEIDLISSSVTLSNRFVSNKPSFNILDNIVFFTSEMLFYGTGQCNNVQMYQWGHCYSQKQPSRGVLNKRCSENMFEIYKRTLMPNCNFNKVY